MCLTLLFIFSCGDKPCNYCHHVCHLHVHAISAALSLRTRSKLVEVSPCCRTQILRYHRVHIIITSFSPIHTLMPHCLLLLDPVLSQFDPHRILTLCSCKFRFNTMRYADQYCSEFLMSPFMLHVSAMSSFYINHFNYCYAHSCFILSV